VHTIKGMSATMGYRAVADLAHEMENLMDSVRQGRVSPGPEMVDLLFAAADALERAVELAVEEGDGEQPEMAALLARLRAAAGDDRRAPVEAPAPEGGPPEHVEGALVVRLRVAPDSMLPGVRAFLALRRTRELGETFSLHPPEAALMEEGFDGALTFLLRTELSPDVVRAAVLAVGEIAEAQVHEDRRGTAAPALPEAESAAGAAAKVRNIRVDLRRLDALMNGVGELVIVRWPATPIPSCWRRWTRHRAWSASCRARSCAPASPPWARCSTASRGWCATRRARWAKRWSS
jgi:two-component system chemotaxis sensor kinase CheA